MATKRTDPIGCMMEMITKKLTLMQIEQMPNVTLMPHTTVTRFSADGVTVEKDGEKMSLEPFQTVILASGMLSGSGTPGGNRKSRPGRGNHRRRRPGHGYLCGRPCRV